MLFPLPEHKKAGHWTQELWEDYKLAWVKARWFFFGSLFGAGVVILTGLSLYHMP